MDCTMGSKLIPYPNGAVPKDRGSLLLSYRFNNRTKIEESYSLSGKLIDFSHKSLTILFFFLQ